MLGGLFNTRSRGNGAGGPQSVSTTYTANHTVLLLQVGQTLIMNSVSDRVFTMCSVAAANIGVWFEFCNINTGKITIDAADSDIIVDSAAGATIYCDDDYIATIILKLVSATRWLSFGATGTWTTT